MRSRSLLLLMAMGSVWLAATSAPAGATFAGPTGRIAFASNAAGDLDIYTMTRTAPGS